MSAVVSTTSRVTCPECGRQATLTVHTTYDGQNPGERRAELGCGCPVSIDRLQELVAGDNINA